MKSSKQKCLEMWEWLAENPGKTKYDYEKYLISTKKGYEFYPCWACYEAGKSRGDCSACPVDSWQKCKERLSCMKEGSPYKSWLYWMDNQTENLKEIKQAAIDMVELIKTQWKE